MKRCQITLVHGTFAKNAAWTAEASVFCKALIDGLSFDVTLKRLNWSGRNRLRDRLLAADELANTLIEQQKREPDCRQIVIGHSHGGSVLAHAITRHPILANCIDGVFLATPFIDARPRRNWFLTAMMLICTFGFTLALVISNSVYLFLFFSESIFHLPRPTEAVARVGIYFAFSVQSIAITTPLVVPFLLLRAGPTRIARQMTTCRLPQGRYLFIRTTGDEANSALATAQFASWLFSRFVGVLLRPLPWNWKIRLPAKLEVPLRFQLLASATLCSFVLLLATYPFSLQEYAKLLAVLRDYAPSYPSFYEMIAEILPIYWKNAPTDAIVNLIFGCVYIVALLYLLVLLSFFSFTWFAYRSFGSASFWAAMLIELAVEPVPLGQQTLLHISWTGGGMSHSSPYQSRASIDVICKWANNQPEKTP